MKKLIVAALAAFCAVSAVFSQESTELQLFISGEAKTGFFVWAKEKDVHTSDDFNNQTGETLPDEGADIHNSELDNWMGYKRLDSLRGVNQGLYRLNFQIEKGNIGAKFRFEMSDFTTGTVNWAYAFLYGSFFDDQFRAAAGKLGQSPWGTAEPDMDRELDTTVGMRFEYLPFFVPGLELGLVLNNWNTAIPGGTTATVTDLLAETVLGVLYTHELFHARFSYRFDSEADKVGGTDRDQGGRMAYRVEERVLGNYLPGLQIWNVGYFEEIGNKAAHMLTGTNYLYTQYEPGDFTARLRLGYDIIDVKRLPNGGQADKSRQWFSVQPSFYYKFFNNLLNAGLSFEFAKDFGDGLVSGAPYLSWYIEPQIKVNIDQGFYIALVYRYHDEYYQMDIQNDPANPEPFNSRTHWVNLRAVYTF
ncbi:MAG: hypothetical protein LBD48_11530 [Treponema sp.]|jgi:hypothetical protein|nr:hypothetical protein [Treponema sp.]